MVHVSSVRVAGCLPVDKQAKIEALQKALADVVYDKDLHDICSRLGQQVAIEPFYYGRSETDEHYNQCFDEERYEAAVAERNESIVFVF